jgi:transposase
VPTIHAALARRNLLPSQHIVDSGYMSGERVLTSQLEYGIDLVGPMRPDVSWQAQQPDTFDLSHFQIDWSARQVTCPGGKTSYYWKPQTGSRDNPVIEIQFRKSECGPCSLRSLCTRSKTGPRNLTVPPQPIFEALHAARARQQTQDFKLTYNQRAGIEGTLSEAVNPLDMRRSRYLGLRKTRLQHIATSLALNMTRLFAWLTNRPLAMTRISPFAALAT